MPAAPRAALLAVGRYAGLAAVRTIDERRGRRAVRLVEGIAIHVALRLVGAGPEAVVVSVAMGDTCRIGRAIDVVRAAFEAAVPTLEGEADFVQVGVAVAGHRALCTDAER